MDANKTQRLVYCYTENISLRDPNVGFLLPIIEEKDGTLISADLSTFPNNHKIYVTRGFQDKFFPHPPGTIFKVFADIYPRWDPSESSEVTSQYCTYDVNSELIGGTDICMIVDAEYPEPTTQSGMECSSRYAPTNIFFIRCTNPKTGIVELIGPLNIVAGSQREEYGSFFVQYKSLDRPMGGVWRKINNAPHSTMSFAEDLLPNSCTLSSQGRCYLVNTKQLPILSAVLLDLSTDQHIIKWATKLLRQSGSSIAPKAHVLREVIDAMPDESDLPLDIYEFRKKRLNYLQENLTKAEGFSHILTEYMKSEEGTNAIKKHVEANRDSLLEKYLGKEMDQVERQAKKQVQLSTTEIENLKREKLSLISTIEELKTSEAGLKVEALSIDINKKRDELNIINEVDELQIQKKLLKNELQDIESQKNEASRLLADIQHIIGSTQQSHKHDLIKLKMDLEAISGNVKSDYELKTNIPVDLLFTEFKASTDHEQKKEVLSNLTLTLQNQGRIIDADEVAVLLTCIIQNLIVTLAGKPGAGKSSVVSELSSILGLRDRNRYVRVQVQRGWVSDRDLLGFYNKLSNYYDPDRFGLYQLINGLQDVPTKCQFSLVLLDEANLSPIEHYWSGFMGACDDSHSFSTQGDKLKLPEGLRFISTVNYDRTTEPLSARFIDRSPVIYVENKMNAFLSNTIFSDEINTEEKYNYSFDDLNRLFGDNNSGLTSDEERIFEQLFTDHKFIPIQPRKVKAVTAFTNTLRDIFISEKGENLKAFDYATLVHIVPMINGQGRDYSSAVTSFKEFLGDQGLDRSSAKVAKIIENSQYDAYSYFS